MMNSIRNRMHIMVWALVVLFVGSMTVGGLVGGADIIDQILGRTDITKAIAVVNGDIISPNGFFQQVNYRLEQFRVQGQEVDERQIDQVRQIVWDDLIEALLVKQEIDRMGISVTDDEIYLHLENTPPFDLQQHPLFQTNDQFDMEKYLQALRNPQGDEWTTIEVYMRDYLPRVKFQSQIRASVTISEEEVKKEYILQNIDYTVSGITIKNRSFTTGIEPLEDEAKDYYNQNKGEFYQEELRSLKYVKWNKSPSKEDTTLTFNEALDLINRIKSGEDFATLANQYSQDPGNKSGNEEGKGGNLGWFDRERMVKSFSDAAFGAEIGVPVGPVLSNFGYHIIQVSDKRQNDEIEEISAGHILLKIEMGPSTREKIRNKAINFSFDVEDYGFEEALQKNNLSANDLFPIPENTRTLPSFGFFTQPVRFAFSSEVGSTSEFFESDRSFAIFHLDSIAQAGTRPFDDVSDKIIRKLRVENQKLLASEIAEQIYENLLAGSTFQPEADSNIEATAFGPVTFKLSNPSRQIGRSPAAKGALLVANVGQIIPPVEISGGYAVLFLEHKPDFDHDDWEVKKNVFYNRLITERQNTAVTEWLKELKERAEIEDNRKYYF
ncbi:MAG: SurA N-terminal domain-containing protein [Candidatus Marinimicrobia bacterium]|nr:SurA N-terminal domain-containing protein [Candidatus Neomarinimicrobiota bacterium]